MTWYNENDPYPADWLENLVRAGELPQGPVDRRSVLDLAPDDVPGTAHFFAGVGGWPLALRHANWPSDLDVWTGSCPCQPFSDAGRRKGTRDDRHLWPAWFGLISQRLPPVVLGEQVASRAGRAWFAAVRADLEGLGYAVGAADLCAAGVGAPHVRQRLYFSAVRLGHAGRPGLEGHPGHGPVQVHGQGAGGPAPEAGWDRADWVLCQDPVRGEVLRPTEPGTFPLAHGVPARVGPGGAVETRPRGKTLKGYGNAIVVPLAAVWARAVLSYLEETR